MFLFIYRTLLITISILQNSTNKKKVLMYSIAQKALTESNSVNPSAKVGT